MNFREGTRRLALLVGALGAIAVGVLSCIQIQQELSQRASHRRFERLVSSSTVKQALKVCDDPYAAIAKPIIDPATSERVEDEHPDYDALAKKYGGVVMVEMIAPDGSKGDIPSNRVQDALKAGFKLAPPPAFTPQASSKTYLDDNGNPIPGQPYQPDPPPSSGDWFANNAPQSSSIPSYCADSGDFMPLKNSDEIKVAHITKTAITSIETTDGRMFFPEQVPSLWWSALWAFAPALGFLVPWGAIRAIGWVGSGFAQPK